MSDDVAPRGTGLAPDMRERLGVEATRLLESAIGSLRSARSTFTEEDALGSLWQAGYEVAAHPDLGFVLARERDGRHERQWRLAEQALANDRLLDALRMGAWDGHDLDAELDRLGDEDSVRYVFCPLDERFDRTPDGTIEPAEWEDEAPVPPNIRVELDALGPALLDRWHQTGGDPQTLRTITGALGELGWPGAHAPEAWLLVRAWLRGWGEVRRVGHDYWVPALNLPEEPQRRRLQVLPVLPSGEAQPAEPVKTDPRTGDSGSAIAKHLADGPTRPDLDSSPTGVQRAAWIVPLRTVHLVEGFVPIPSSARAVYPPRSPGEGERTVLRCLWFDTNDRLWVWLDRSGDRLYGPQVADQLAWCEAGDLLRVEWEPETIVLRIVGHDEGVEQEESRLVDLEALATLRRGLGESYRQSLQVILDTALNGLTFRELVTALEERQQHSAHQGTIRALLRAGGFVLRDGRWFPPPDPGASARRLRRALVETIRPLEVLNGDETTQAGGVASPQTLVRSIRQRLEAIVGSLRERA